MLSAKQMQILRFPRSEHSVLICDGAVRSGKTSIMSLVFVLWAMHCFNRRNFAVCGKSVQSAVRNILRPLMEMTYWSKEGFALNYSVSSHMLAVTRGSVSNYFYLFGGKDERSQDLIQGITLAGVMLDEVALMPESFVNQATARCSVEGARIWFNCNPEGPQHWFYLNWIQKAKEKDAEYLHFSMTDNPSLSEETLRRYESMYTGVFYDRYIRGEWVVAEGRVYPMFTNSPDRFIFRGSTAGMNGQFFVSIDYGTVNPTAMQLWCVREKEAVMLRESYFDSRKEGRQKTDEEHYAALEKLTQGYYIRRVIVDPSAASFIETIRRHGKFRVWGAENDVINGIRITATMISGGMIKIHENCKDTIREFSLYRWDEKKNEDAVIKENDHAMDAMRYFCSTVLSREFRWVPWG